MARGDVLEVVSVTNKTEYKKFKFMLALPIPVYDALSSDASDSFVSVQEFVRSILTDWYKKRPVKKE